MTHAEWLRREATDAETWDQPGRAERLRAIATELEQRAAEIEEWEERWAKEFALRGHETAQLERRIADQNAEIARLEELVRESANQLSNL